MNKEDYVAWIRSQDGFHNLIEEIDNDNIVYNRNAVWVDPEAPDFLDTKTHLNDEEAVRAAFLLLLSRDFEYELTPRSIELEHVYQAPDDRDSVPRGVVRTLLLEMVREILICSLN